MDAERDIYIYIYNIDIYMRLLLSSQLSPPPASSREEEEEVIWFNGTVEGGVIASG